MANNNLSSYERELESIKLKIEEQYYTICNTESANVETIYETVEDLLETLQHLLNNKTKIAKSNLSSGQLASIKKKYKQLMKNMKKIFKKGNIERERILNQIKQLTQMIETNSNTTTTSETLLQRATCYAKLGDWKNQAADLESAIETNPQILIPTSILLYEIYNRDDNFNHEKALFHLERAFEESKKTNHLTNLSFLYNNLFARYHDMNQFERALSLANEGVKFIESRVIEYPEESYDLCILLGHRGNLLIKEFNMLEEGIKDLNRALEIDSNKYETLLLMLEAYSYKNQHPKLLLETYELVKETQKLETEPMDEETLLGYEDLHKLMQQYFYERNEFKQAIECIRKYILRRGESSLLENYFFFCYLCLIDGDFAKLLLCMKSVTVHAVDANQLLEEFPQLPIKEDQQFVNLSILGLYYFYIDDFQDAIMFMEKLKELFKSISPNSASKIPIENLNCLFNIIQTYSNLRLGNEKLTFEYATEARKLFPRVLRVIVEFYLIEQSNFPLARKYANESFDETKDLKDLEIVAETYMKEKNYSKAIKECERIIEIDSSRCIVLFMLGEAYFHLKEFKLAREFIEKCLFESEKQNIKQAVIEMVNRLWPEYFELKETL